MAKMIDVAKLAGVSVATVSRVLAGSGKVSKNTKEKVERAMKELNYKPNKLARNLRKLESKTIVVVIPDISNPFFTDVIRGIQQVAQQHDYYVLLGDTGNDVKAELDFIDLIKERAADGVILVTARTSPEKILEIAQEVPLVVACEYIKGAHLSMVTIDNVSSSQKVVDHLVSLGHRRIGFISGPLNVIISRDRLKGYVSGLKKHGLEQDSSLIQEGDFTISSGFESANRLLDLAEPPTAVFASNDEMAIGTIKAIKNRGFQVPGDIAVVGFDDIQIATVIEPALTTVSQPKFEIGRCTMEILLELIQNPSTRQEHVVLPEHLVIRESCGYPLVR
ncbi:LacI family DNA-binding transcriptional regulator [Paenactinomyces guangxiensis]|uniref:LacI family DNA-binding transcriptional regulator n=1 Tax=Paenactinomyces guangxiensis TaxID=1490290 RepID=A0A7W2A9M5_9BACL|nr:LacI family DNA-binding transcriptional regulator [Paenactinomyces guangxiensis]MBA4495347.1 LacI family DNA-binding transcriptional regulator [Paenactinomyces guangxiensis]MBH8592532.1 LacI family DNA-binding transcriptional regulator [Paenactinomyces guangxiensis]